MFEFAAGASLRPAHLHIEWSRPCVIVVLVVASLAPWARLPVDCWASHFFRRPSPWPTTGISLSIQIQPNSHRNLRGRIRRFLPCPPAVHGSVQGNQEFAYTDTTTGDTGEFFGLESSSPDGSYQEVYVLADPSGSDAPSVGSVFDTTTAGPFTNVYADLVSATGGADTITDTLETPFGDYNIPITFDAADFRIADADGVTIGYGTVIDPVGSQAINAITGISPIDVALQGTQYFDVDNSTNPAFYAVDTTTADILSTYTEAVLVTKDLEGTVGTTALDTSAVGSIVNTIGAGDIELVYSELLGTNGGPDLITDWLYTPFGNFEIPTTFEAAQAEDTAAIDLPGGDHLTPLGTLDFTGVNGLPPVDVGVQGTQDFEFANAGGATGQFTADVTNTLDCSMTPRKQSWSRPTRTLPLRSVRYSRLSLGVTPGRERLHRHRLGNRRGRHDHGHLGDTPRGLPPSQHV